MWKNSAKKYFQYGLQKQRVVNKYSQTLDIVNQKFAPGPLWACDFSLVVKKTVVKTVVRRPDDDLAP